MNSIIKDKYFIMGLIFKISLLPFFASKNFSELFVPFLDYFSTNVLSNPWAQFGPAHFPYGPIQLLIISFPKILINTLLPFKIIGSSYINFFIYKLPLLVCDILCLAALNNLTQFKTKKSLLLLYWLNPVLIYISYVHGQLDLISIFLLLTSILALTRSEWIKSSLFFSAAALCKFHVVITLPFLLAYIWNRLFFPKSFNKLGIYLLIIFCTVMIGFYPHIQAGYFSYVTTNSPQAQSIFGANISYDSQRVLFLGILLLFLSTLRLIFSTSISPTGLIFGSGFLLNILLISTDFSPGWFFWVIPFYALAYSINRSLPKGLLSLFMICFFIYFGIPEMGILGFYETGGMLSSLSFTILQSFLILFSIIIYMGILKWELPIKRRTLPLMIGISGDSGSGKNYLSDVLGKIFPSRNKIIEGDDYHKWERGDSNWEKFTHLNPLANHLNLMTEHAKQLIGGSIIFNRHYNHQTGKFDQEREISPAQIIFFQGLHTLYLKSSRDLFDIKIFCNPHPLLKFYWKIRRDTLERGHSVEKVITSFEKRQQDSKEHIETQLKYADWVVETSFCNDYSRDDILSNKVPKDFELKFKHILWNDTPIFDIIDFLSSYEDDRSFKLNLHEIDTERIAIEFQGRISSNLISETALTLFPELRSLTRSRTEPSWLSDNDGISQLIAISLLSNKKKG